MRSAVASAVLGLLLPLCGAASAEASVRHVPLTPQEMTGLAFPSGQRVPAGWPAFAVGGDPVVLRLSAGATEGAAWLRITTAVDDREERWLEVGLEGDSQLLGRLDLRFAHALQTFQMRLPDGILGSVMQRGITLRLRGPGSPLWFISCTKSGYNGTPPPAEFQPHVMVAESGVDRWSEFRQRFGSLASLQTFGWMEGCVLDGLHDLGSRPGGERFRLAAAAHWRIFLPRGNQLVYETPRGMPADGRIYGIEGGLPFADLVRRDPRNAAVDLFLDFVRTRQRGDGAIQDADLLSTEGSYTIGYPLAVIAAARGDRQLAESALGQLRLRSERLWHDGAIWLRRTDAGVRSFRGWSRGVAWHALGVARSLRPLREAGVDTRELEREMERIAAWTLPLQRSDGLWSCYVEDVERGLPDSSGSAGIAAALAIAAREGAIGEEAVTRARRTLAALEAFLTPDGLLNGAAQSNRGGEALQRSDYRVLSQMGMGLLAQLMAAVDESAGMP